MTRMRYIALPLLLLASPIVAVENWPQFRGPNGDGQSSGSRLPISWNETENILWKTPIHGRGWSSPVIWGSQLWVTTATEDGKQMFAVCVDRDTGKILHDVLVFENDEPRYRDPTNSYASPTPVIEPGLLYVHFGSYGTVCLDTNTTEILWQRRDLHCHHWRGPMSLAETPSLSTGKDLRRLLGARLSCRENYTPNALATALLGLSQRSSPRLRFSYSPLLT